MHSHRQDQKSATSQLTPLGMPQPNQVVPGVTRWRLLLGTISNEKMIENPQKSCSFQCWRKPSQAGVSWAGFCCSTQQWVWAAWQWQELLLSQLHTMPLPGSQQLQVSYPNNYRHENMSGTTWHSVLPCSSCSQCNVLTRMNILVFRSEI